MKKVVIMASGPVNASPDCQIEGEYLKAYDPEAFDGQGDAAFTLDIREAMCFDDTESAMKFAYTVPTKRPKRFDGKANRPLATFSLDFVNIEFGDLLKPEQTNAKKATTTETPAAPDPA